MSPRVVDLVDDWDEQSFTDGYGELQALADRRFSGVIRAGGAELYMTKGVVVGIRRGDIDDFEDATGTAYSAPSPALPVLAIMQEESDGVRDQFYTEKTPIEEVDKTLASGGFTGYIELSENVLSGDYYLVYHGGESMSVGYVGASERLIDADEAFDTANDEVGIYKVRQVDLEPVEIPTPAGANEPDPATQSGQESAGNIDGASGDGEPTESGAIDESGGSDTGRNDVSPAGANGEPAQQSATQESAEQPRSRSQDAAGGTESDGAEATGERTQKTARDGDGTAESVAPHRREDSRTSESSDDTQSANQGATGSGERRQAEQPRADDGRTTRTEPAGQASQGQTSSEPSKRQAGHSQPQETTESTSTQPAPSRQEREQRRKKREPIPEGSLDLETRAIPSLDPSRTRTIEKEQPEPDVPSRTTGSGSTATQSTPTRASQSSEAHQTESEPPADREPVEAVESERIDELEDELDERDSRIDELEAQLDEVKTDREQLRAELESVTAERDELAAELEELETELTRLETELGAATNAEERMSPGEALSGTDVFIRYHSKGEATLEKAHGSSARRDEVNENLRLEKHTQFDKATVAVGGRSYEEFLESTVEYQFVEWVVRELLFEIRETGHEKQLKDLYDVLAKIDRAELAGVVEITYTEDGEEHRTQESFDVVLRNRMGNPLLVANLNDSREAATGSMMEGLITAAERVGKGMESFAGAFMVTTSFFDPGALEITSEATQGGILSRDKRKSFVNLSRKRGYHLCLVEARNENFHLAVPEL